MASLKYGWKPATRSYAVEYSQESCNFETADSHPLVTVVKTIDISGKQSEKKTKKEKEQAFIDPLSSVTDPLSVSSVQDPLSAALFSESVNRSAPQAGAQKAKEPVDDENILAGDFETWSTKKTSILSKYTTSEKISITTSFLSNEDKEKLETKAQAASADTFKHRLEQLDDMEEGSVKETLTLTQREYVDKIEQLNLNLSLAWEREQKVKALKIAIQCAKLLADTSVIQFYPSKFVLVTEILDNFGVLVFERIRQKSAFQPGESKPKILPENFTPEEVPDSAKETCRNWFFKIASIRELIPRFFVEVAILKCYSFLAKKEYRQALIRLSSSARGMGDPLVAAYARTYLSRVGISVAPATRDHLLPCYCDTLQTLHQFKSERIQDILGLQRLNHKMYISLFEPAFDWNFQCLAHRCSESVLEEVLDKFKSFPKDVLGRGLVLYSIMSSFKPDYVASRSLQFAELIKTLDEDTYSKNMLYATLGTNVALADPPKDDRMPLLKLVWKVISSIDDAKEFVTCAEAWIEYVAKHFTKREINLMLGDIIKHMTVDRAFESHYPQLLTIISKILSHMHNNFSDLFAMEHFLSFVDLLQKESVKVEACKSICSTFAAHQMGSTSDPVILNAMMYLGKVMHDSLSAMSLKDECRQVSNLINSFISKVDFGQDFEQQLSFFVDARASYTNLDQVLIHLVQCVNQLAMNTLHIVKGIHKGKTSAFVRACFAYCFITIPSLTNVFAKLNLYLLSGRVAIINGALSQGDAFLKNAITLIPDIPEMLEINNKRQSTETFITTFCQNFLSTLLVVPDNPDLGVVYLLSGLLNALRKYSWQTNSLAKVVMFSDALFLLSAICQEEYIYHIHNVDSNDSLYASDPKFLAEIASLVDVVLNTLKDTIAEISEPHLIGRAAVILFRRAMTCSQLSDDKMAAFIRDIWKQINATTSLPAHIKDACRQSMLTHKVAVN